MLWFNIMSFSVHTNSTNLRNLQIYKNIVIIIKSTFLLRRP